MMNYYEILIYIIRVIKVYFILLELLRYII